MSERVSPTVFAGVGDDGSSAPSRSRFLAEYVGGTGMEAAEAWRNSANASSRILTRVLREASVLLVTGREQHAGCARKKLRRRRWRSRRGRRSQSLRTSSGTVSGGLDVLDGPAFSGSGCSGLIVRPIAISEKSPTSLHTCLWEEHIKHVKNRRQAHAPKIQTHHHHTLY